MAFPLFLGPRFSSAFFVSLTLLLVSTRGFRHLGFLVAASGALERISHHGHCCLLLLLLFLRV
jgi:hypothetical protein